MGIFTRLWSAVGAIADTLYSLNSTLREADERLRAQLGLEALPQPRPEALPGPTSASPRPRRRE